MFAVVLSVKGNTLTTDITASGTGINPLPSNQVAVTELSAVSVATADASVVALLISSDVILC